MVIVLVIIIILIVFICLKFFGPFRLKESYQYSKPVQEQIQSQNTNLIIRKCFTKQSSFFFSSFFTLGSAAGFTVDGAIVWERAAGTARGGNT